LEPAEHDAMTFAELKVWTRVMRRALGQERVELEDEGG
jgi:hypothetical protein